MGYSTAMLRRLLLTLLLLALSTPALAMSGHCAPHDDAAAMHHDDAGHEPHPASTQSERGDCIGCVLPGLGILAAPKAQTPATVIGAMSQQQPLTLTRQGPTPPPPRS